MSATTFYEGEDQDSAASDGSWPVMLGWVLALLSCGLSWAGNAGMMSILSGSAFLLAAVPTVFWLQRTNTAAYDGSLGVCLAAIASLSAVAAAHGGYADGLGVDFGVLLFAPLLALSASRKTSALLGFMAVSALYLLLSPFVLPASLLGEQASFSGNLILLVLVVGVAFASLAIDDAPARDTVPVSVAEVDAAEEKVRGLEAMVAEQTTQIERYEAQIAGLQRSIGQQLSVLDDATRSITESAANLQRNTQCCSEHTNQVMRSSETASSSVQTVSAASEELSSSISEISRQIAQANGMVETATRGAQETNSTIGSLAEAANRIGEVVTLIQAIAEQTNLLALNATIEAARAGEAGKGFAVVAAEVKELANQTSKATEEIASQVSAIQGRTREAVEAIGVISQVMEEVNSHTGSIAAAVSQQGHATNEISVNIAAAADGTMAVTQRLTGLHESIAETDRFADGMTTQAGCIKTELTEVQSTLDEFFKETA